MLKKGDRAPDFTVQDHHDKVVRLADLAGKTVVLWFFPKADTPGCTAEGCSFRDLSADFAKKKAVIYGVSVDTPAANAAFVKKYHFTFSLLCDVERRMGLAYGACEDVGAKTFKRIGVVIDPQGKIHSVQMAVDAKSWPQQVLAEL